MAVKKDRVLGYALQIFSYIGLGPVQIPGNYNTVI